MVWGLLTWRGICIWLSTAEHYPSHLQHMVVYHRCIGVCVVILPMSVHNKNLRSVNMGTTAFSSTLPSDEKHLPLFLRQKLWLHPSVTAVVFVPTYDEGCITFQCKRVGFTRASEQEHRVHMHLLYATPSSQTTWNNCRCPATSPRLSSSQSAKNQCMKRTIAPVFRHHVISDPSKSSTRKKHVSRGTHVTDCTD